MGRGLLSQLYVLFQQIIPPGAFRTPGLLTPAIQTIGTVVEYLAVGDSVVSVVPEVFRNAQRTRQVLFRPCIIAEESIRCRPYSCHKACTRGTADRDLTIGTQKNNTVRSQPVYVGRKHLLMAVAAKLRT